MLSFFWIQIIDRKSAIDPLASGGRQIEALRGEIKLNCVTFSYPARPDTAVLKSFDWRIEAGKSTALVGASGKLRSSYGLDCRSRVR